MIKTVAVPLLLYLPENGTCAMSALVQQTSSAHRSSTAIASIPEDIRGYGHVKERHLTAAKAKEAALLANFGVPAVSGHAA